MKEKVKITRSAAAGCSVAVRYPGDVISGIVDLPTQEYYDWYNTINSRLYSLTVFAVNLLEDWGYKAEILCFFRDEETAIKAGYRPCAVCMPEKYKEWKEKQTK